MKKAIVVLSCVLMLTFVLTACGNNTSPSTTPEATPTPAATPTPTPAATPEPTPVAVDEDLPLISQGVFEYWLRPEGYDPFWNYYHFYPNGVFYCSYHNGSTFKAGYYEIKDEAFAYTDKDGVDGVMTQTLVLTLPDGTEYETIGYDPETGIIGTIKGMYDNIFTQNFEVEHTSADENGVALTEYMLGEDDYSLLRFMHNGTFEDTIGPLVEGPWLKDGNNYILTDSETGGTYTFVVNEDNTGTYTGLDGTTQTLNLVREAETMMTFYGSITATYGEMVLEMKCLDGGKAVMNMNYGGRDMPTDGTWELAADYSAVNLTIGDTSFSAPRNTEDNSFSFEYTANDGAVDVVIPMGTKEPVTLLYTFVGKNNTAVIMECYSDGTCAVVYTGMGTISLGTWSMDRSNALPTWTVELEETFENQGVTVEADATGFFFSFKNTTGQLEDVLELPYSAMQ